MTPPPCHRNPAFTNVNTDDGQEIQNTREICQSCPLLKTCAKDALYSGTSLDGHYTRPANNVIQAGVLCTGDHRTAAELAQIAGLPTPAYRNCVPRQKPPATCLSCHQAMVSWTRRTVPEEHVMHYARGYCTNCRGAYQAAMDKAAAIDERPRSITRRDVCKGGKNKRNPVHSSSPCPKRKPPPKPIVCGSTAALLAGR